MPEDPKNPEQQTTEPLWLGTPQPLFCIHDPYPVPASGTSLPDNPTELVKHQFLIYESDLVDVVVDEINFPSQAITGLIRSKLATICSNIDRYHWRVYASRLDSSAITITAYGTPK